MALTYILGVPYELPRLWVVFIPLLVLGATIDLPMFHARRRARAVAALMLVAFVQVVFVAMQWSMLDVRQNGISNAHETAVAVEA